MYIDQIKINDLSVKLSNETIEKILKLIFDSSKFSTFKVDKNSVRNNFNTILDLESSYYATCVICV